MTLWCRSARLHSALAPCPGEGGGQQAKLAPLEAAGCFTSHITHHSCAPSEDVVVEGLVQWNHKYLTNSLLLLQLWSPFLPLRVPCWTNQSIHSLRSMSGKGPSNPAWFFQALQGPAGLTAVLLSSWLRGGQEPFSLLQTLHESVLNL